MDKLEALKQRIMQFTIDRNWMQYHTPVNLSKSIAIEAGELLECFQWDGQSFNRQAVIEEVADVMNYCIQLTQVLGVDMIDIINEKMDKNEKKYPVEKARGNATKYDKL